MAETAKSDTASVAGERVIGYVMVWFILATVVFVGSVGVKFGGWITEKWGYTSGQVAITADSDSYVACDGVNISTDGTWGGEQVYTVSFSDPTRTKISLHGVHRITTIKASGLCGDNPRSGQFDWNKMPKAQ